MMECWKSAIGVLAALCCAGAVWGAEESTSYTYDEAGRLAAAYTTRGQTNMAALYQYDLAGNRTRGRSFAPAHANGDLDGDALNDGLELHYFKNLDEDAGSDPDADGLANSNEFAASGSPLLSDTDGDWQSDLEEFIAGTALNDETQYFYVTNALPIVGGQVRIMCDTRAGRTYQLQTCSDPTQAWADEGAPYEAAVDGPHDFDVISGTNASFRIRVHLTPY
ncbi:MAG: hypothetical protein JXB04_13385 [Kiritimatiellae bacterium]|nr:hypothetical protein [Kiritimatiellia bacterium]